MATSAVRELVGLAILGHDLDLVGLAGDLQPRCEKLADPGQRPILRLGKAGHRTGLWTDMTNLDDKIVGAQDVRSEHRARGQGRGACLQHAAAGWMNGDHRPAPSPLDYFICHFPVLPSFAT